MKPEKSLSRWTKRVFGLLAASAAIFCAVSVSPVQAGDLFYTTCWFDGTKNDLVAISVQDVNHITTKLIGEICCGGTAALALSSSGTLYGMVGNPFFVSQQLATIDRATGYATLFGVPVPGLAVMAMGFAPDGTLYAIGGVTLALLARLGLGVPLARQITTHSTRLTWGLERLPSSVRLAPRNTSWTWRLIATGTCTALRATSFLPKAIPLRCTASTVRPGWPRRSSISWEAPPLWDWRSTGAEANCMRPTGTAIIRLCTRST